MSGSRQRKLIGSVRVTAGIVSYRRGYKSWMIPWENGFQWAAGIDGRSAGSCVSIAWERTRRSRWKKEGVLCSSSVNERVSRWSDDLTRLEILISGWLETLWGDPSLRMHRDAASNPHINRCEQPRLTTLWPWLGKKMTYVRLYRWGNDEKKDDKRKSFLSSRMATQSEIREMRFSVEQRGPPRAAESAPTSESSW